MAKNLRKKLLKKVCVSLTHVQVLGIKGRMSAQRRTFPISLFLAHGEQSGLIKKKVPTPLLLQVQHGSPTLYLFAVLVIKILLFDAIREIHGFFSLFINNFTAAIAAPCRRQKNLTNERFQFQVSKGQLLETSVSQTQLSANHKKYF